MQNVELPNLILSNRGAGNRLQEGVRHQVPEQRTHLPEHGRRVSGQPVHGRDHVRQAQQFLLQAGGIPEG